MTTGNRPIKKWAAGNIQVALWENKKEFNGGEVSFKTFSLSRSYMKKDENMWRSEVINNLRRQDVIKLLTVLHEVQRELYLDKHDKDEGEENE